MKSTSIKPQSLQTNLNQFVLITRFTFPGMVKEEMVTVKAIETSYHGYHFRSRLEARWAVFFDSLEIPFRYEPEGFDLDGIWYLPDFYLPKHRCWIEIKPDLPSKE